MEIQYPRRLITYKGIEFLSDGYRHDEVCIVTHDPVTAAELGFTEVVWRGQHQYEKWIPNADVDRWVEQNALGRYMGEEVEIGSLDDETCFIDAQWNLPGLEQRDRALWQGTVPRQLVTDIRVVETEENLWRWRKKKKRT